MLDVTSGGARSSGFVRSHSLLDLGPRARVVACVLFFGSEVILIATGRMCSDQAYAFHMFPESSSITVHLSRRLEDGSVEKVEDGRWVAQGCDHTSHVVVWNKLVHGPAPSRLDTSIGAPYGVEAEIQRTRDAMQWVLDHVASDCETRALLAKIDVRRNGRPSHHVDVEVRRSATRGDSP